MKKVTFNVILRMPNYCSEGLLQIIDQEDVKALFTVDKAIGTLKNGTMKLTLQQQYLERIGHFNSLQYQIQIVEHPPFIIDVGKLYSPMVYFFSHNNNNDDYSLEFVSIEENVETIDYLEDSFR